MRKFFSKVGLAIAGFTGMAVAAPLSAPDTSDITANISTMVGAAVVVILAYIGGKWALKALGLMK